MKAGDPGAPLEPPYDWLPQAALTRLGRRVERLVNANGWGFDHFTPEDYLEGELGEAILQNFVAEAGGRRGLCR